MIVAVGISVASGIELESSLRFRPGICTTEQNFGIFFFLFLTYRQGCL